MVRVFLHSVRYRQVQVSSSVTGGAAKKRLGRRCKPTRACPHRSFCLSLDGTPSVYERPRLTAFVQTAASDRRSNYMPYAKTDFHK